MVWVDVAILIIVGISTLISLIRGFVKEALSLVVWGGAFVVALVFSPQMGEFLQQWITEPTLNRLAAYTSLFVATLLVGGLLNYLVGQFIKSTGLSGTDRTIGAVFGIFRGVVIVAALLMIAGYTTVPQSSWWRESMFIEHLEPVASWLKEQVSDDIATAKDKGIKAAIDETVKQIPEQVEKLTKDKSL